MPGRPMLATVRRRLVPFGFATILVVVAGVVLFSVNRPPAYTSDLRHEVGGVFVGPALPCAASAEPCAHLVDIARTRLVEQLGAVEVASVAGFQPPVLNEWGQVILYGAGGSDWAFTLADGRVVVVPLVCPEDC